MHLIDSHTHLDFDDFAQDRTQVLQRSRALGVQQMVVLGVRQRHWQRVWDLVNTQSNLFAALGLHPLFLQEHQPQHVAELGRRLKQLREHPKLCAVGEIGLDYFLPTLDKNAQQQLFEAQLALACELALPALLHVRRAHAQSIATLKRFKPERGGIVHAFSGSLEEAKAYIRLGFKLGLGGAATWPQATRMHNMIAQLPDEAIVLETDSPDMPPAMYPNQRNSPEHLPAICQALAELRQCSPAQLAAQTSANACQLFGWPAPPRPTTSA